MPRTRLKELLGILEDIAPLGLAEDWDNVGLLLEPKAKATVRRALLTIDLSPAVFAECLEAGCDLIISYHPPIFSGLKRLTRGDPQQEILLEAARKGIAIYAPHTALDAAPGGVNDWLIGALGRGETTAIQQQSAFPDGMDTKIAVFVPESHAESLRAALARSGCGLIGDYAECAFELQGRGTFRGNASSRPKIGESGRLERVPELRLEMVCRSSDLADVARVIRDAHPYEEPAWDAYALRPRPDKGRGQGRAVTLSRPLGLASVTKKIKKHLGLSHVRVAASARHEAGEKITSAAVCAGAGASVLLGHNADLLLTGEMRHHDVLACVNRGQSVILCDHTNTERGFLPYYAAALTERAPDVEFLVSDTDRDPLRVV